MVNIIPGFGHIAGEALIKHPGIDKIAFTGSTEVGKHIMANTGIKRKSLELGGKNPNIVFDDANLDYAVGLSMGAGLFNSG